MPSLIKSHDQNPQQQTTYAQNPLSSRINDTSYQPHQPQLNGRSDSDKPTGYHNKPYPFQYPPYHSRQVPAGAPPQQQLSATQIGYQRILREQQAARLSDVIVVDRDEERRRQYFSQPQPKGILIILVINDMTTIIAMRS